MQSIRKSVLALIVGGSMFTGALAGAVAFGAHAANADTPSASPSASPSAQTRPAGGAGASGKFTPNEDAAHEAGESPEREAQEDAGQVPTIP